MKTIMLFAILATLGFACSKEQTQPTQQAVSPDAVWVTPNGKVIPYSERANWVAYEKANFSQEKIDVRYGSEECTTPTIACGLLCKVSRTNDCTKESACAPCMNCGCTPSSPTPR